MFKSKKASLFFIHLSVVIPLTVVEVHNHLILFQSHLRSAPSSSISFNQIMRGFWSPCSGLVVGEINLVFRRRPFIQDRHDEFPAALGHVLARIESRIA